MSNYPDDWNCHFSTCSQCGGVNHASGTYECGCRACLDCGENVTPEEATCVIDVEGDETDDVRCWDCEVSHK